MRAGLHKHALGMIHRRLFNIRPQGVGDVLHHTSGKGFRILATDSSGALIRECQSWLAQACICDDSHVTFRHTPTSCGRSPAVQFLFHQMKTGGTLCDIRVFDGDFFDIASHPRDGFGVLAPDSS